MKAVLKIRQKNVTLNRWLLFITVDTLPSPINRNNKKTSKVENVKHAKNKRELLKKHAFHTNDDDEGEKNCSGDNGTKRTRRKSALGKENVKHTPTSRPHYREQ